MTETVVLDASAMVTMLVGGGKGRPIIERLRGTSVHVPAHFDAEVLSALVRLQRAGDVSPAAVAARLERLAAAPFERHALAPLLTPAWRLRGDMRLVDALYVALATAIGATVITMDHGLSVAAPRSELPIPPSDLGYEMRDE